MCQRKNKQTNKQTKRRCERGVRKVRGQLYITQRPTGNNLKGLHGTGPPDEFVSVCLFVSLCVLFVWDCLLACLCSCLFVCLFVVCLIWGGGGGCFGLVWFGF